MGHTPVTWVIHWWLPAGINPQVWILSIQIQLSRRTHSRSDTSDTRCLGTNKPMKGILLRPSLTTFPDGTMRNSPWARHMLVHFTKDTVAAIEHVQFPFLASRHFSKPLFQIRCSIHKPVDELLIQAEPRVFQPGRLDWWLGTIWNRPLILSKLGNHR